MVRIGLNIASLNAQRRLAENSDALSKTYERLSSGQRINRASDDAAGLSISSILRSDSQVLTQAIRNVNDGISLLNIAEGTLSSLNNIVTRIIELSEQASNGVYSLTQRKALHQEADALRNEYNRVVASSSFNGRSIYSNPANGDVIIQSGIGELATTALNIGDGLNRSVGTGALQNLAALPGIISNYTMETGDFNGDGNLDLFTSYGTSQTLLGNGDGTFAVVSGGFVGGLNRQSLVFDYNHDGYDDVLSGSSTAGLNVLVSNGNGTFRVVQSIGSGATFVNGIYLSDFNNDGLEDLSYLTNAGIMVSLRNGDGTFGSITTFTLPYVAEHMDVGDLNNDGNVDIVFSDAGFDGQGNPVTYRMMGLGNGTFTSPITSVGMVDAPVRLYDFNRDGNLDVVTQHRIAIGNGDGTFKAPTSFTTANSEQFELFDMNNDNLLDIVYADRDAGQSMKIFLSNGDGTFALTTINHTLGVASVLNATPGDFNNDGAPDVVISRFTDASGVFIGGTPIDSAYIGYTNLLTRSNALATLEQGKQQLQRISQESSQIGAVRSRLEVNLNVLATQSEQYMAAAARITDVDVAETAATLARQKILQEAATAVLQQANLLPALALKLLDISG